MCAKKIVRSVREKRSASENRGVLQVRLYHATIAGKVIDKSSVKVYRKQPVSGMVTESSECVLTKDAVEYLRANALQADLHALIEVFDHKSTANEKLDGKTDSGHYAAAIKALLAAAGEDLKDKPSLARTDSSPTRRRVGRRSAHSSRTAPWSSTGMPIRGNL